MKLSTTRVAQHKSGTGTTLSAKTFLDFGNFKTRRGADFSIVTVGFSLEPGIAKAAMVSLCFLTWSEHFVYGYEPETSLSVPVTSCLFLELASKGKLS